MKRLLPLLILILQVLNISCEYDTQYISEIAFVVENKSSKSLNIVEVDYLSEWNSVNHVPISIEPNKSATLLAWVEKGNLTPDSIGSVDFYTPNKVRMVFDNEFAIEYIKKGYDAESEASGIIRMDRCKTKKIKDGEIRITYIFTDEDYEYAKEHGENLYE